MGELTPPECPYCGRVMSLREAAEQGACNDCYDASLATIAAAWLEVTRRDD
jgi:hypothetical protein